ncbi:MAG TPA: hypothetical protein VMC43_00465 [Candidatus Paceibacterota bacterium]|nr:hypothetical protein [Candidatus Paceibacterota bacterium]
MTNIFWQVLWLAPFLAASLVPLFIFLYYRKKYAEIYIKDFHRLRYPQSFIFSGYYIMGIDILLIVFAFAFSSSPFIAGGGGLFVDGVIVLLYLAGLLTALPGSLVFMARVKSIAREEGR